MSIFAFDFLGFHWICGDCILHNMNFEDHYTKLLYEVLNVIELMETCAVEMNI